MFSFRCPGCASVYASPPYQAGVPMDCPRCSQRFAVPRDPSPAAPDPADIPSDQFWLPAEESAVLAPRPQSHPPAAGAPGGPAHRPMRWGPWVAAGAGVAGLVVGVVAALLLLGGRHDPAPHDPAPRAQAKDPDPARPPAPTPPAAKRLRKLPGKGDNDTPPPPKIEPDEKPMPPKVEPVKQPAQAPPERKSMDRLDRTKLDVVLPPVREGDRPPPVWEGHTNHIRRVAFTDDGQFVLSISGDFANLKRPADNSIRVWDARRGKQVHKLEGFAEPLAALSVSPGGRYALFGYGGHWEGNKLVPAKTFGLLMLDIQTKRLLGPGADLAKTDPGGDSSAPRFLGLNEEVGETAFVPGRTEGVPATAVATGRRGALILWETATGDTVFQRKIERTQSPPGVTNGMRQVKFTPDGRRLVLTHGDYTVRIHRADNGNEVCPPLKSHEDTIWALDVGRGPDGAVRFLTGGGNRQKKDGTGFEPGAKDYVIRLWDFEKKEVLRRFEGHTNIVFAVAFCPDGRHFVSGGGDGTVRLWDAETGKEVRVLGRHDGAVRSVAVAPDGRSCVSGGHDCKVRFWSLATE